MNIPRAALSKLLAAALVGCGLLCGCLPTGERDVEGLLSPPRLTAEQASIAGALEKAGAAPMVLVNPAAGKESSPVLLSDLNNDGKEDAVVFFIAEQQSKNVRMALLLSEGGGYRLQSLLEGPTPMLEQLSLAKLFESGAQQLVTGFFNPATQQRELRVYSCAEVPNKLQLKEIYAQPYSKFLVGGLAADNKDDLLIAQDPAGGQPLTLSYVRGNGGALQKTSTLALDPSYLSCLSLQHSKSGDSRLVVADCAYGPSGSLISSAAVYSQGGQLYAYRQLQGQDFAARTYRASPLLGAFDLDGDSAVEIPTVTGVLQGDSTGARFSRIAWFEPGRSLFLPKLTGYADMLKGYFVQLSDDLLTKVRVRTGTGESYALMDRTTGELLADIQILPRGVDAALSSLRDYQVVYATPAYRVYLKVAEKSLLSDGVLSPKNFIPLSREK